MTYAERLAEFVRVTGSKPGEMNVRRIKAGDHVVTTVPMAFATVSLEPPSQSAGPGRCNRFTRAVAPGDPTPCKLPANHEGPHSHTEGWLRRDGHVVGVTENPPTS